MGGGEVVVPDTATSPVPPFPWFGGKRKVAGEVWRRFGDVTTYVEPFAGAAAVLLARPDRHRWWERFETINDADGHVVNVFRALAADPAAVARHAAWPVSEVDLTARHLWLTRQQPWLAERLFADPDFFDARAAGWWLWGVSAWVGGDWCTGAGPYTGNTDTPITRGGNTPGVYRKMPMVSGTHGGRGVHRPRPVTGSVPGVHGTPVPDVIGSVERDLRAEFTVLANRLRRVRVTCGQWDRVLGSAAVPPAGQVAGVFLDPPYDAEIRRGDLYAVGDRPADRTVAVHAAARSWALQHGEDSRYRIAYCAYTNPADTALFTSAGWLAFTWQTAGGYGTHARNRAWDNRTREVVWFSPGCRPAAAEPIPLFPVPGRCDVEASNR